MNISKTMEKLRKFPVLIGQKKCVLSIDYENLEHSLIEDIDSDESDVSIYSDTTYVDSFECNIEDCTVSHTSTYKKENASDGYKTPSLESFMNSTINIRGSEIIQQMTFYAHKLRECEQKLIEEYDISPVTVKRWMEQL